MIFLLILAAMVAGTLLGFRLGYRAGHSDCADTLSQVYQPRRSR